MPDEWRPSSISANYCAAVAASDVPTTRLPGSCSTQTMRSTDSGDRGGRCRHVHDDQMPRSFAASLSRRGPLRSATSSRRPRWHPDPCHSFPTIGINRPGTDRWPVLIRSSMRSPIGPHSGGAAPHHGRGAARPRFRRATRSPSVMSTSAARSRRDRRRQRRSLQSAPGAASFGSTFDSSEIDVPSAMSLIVTHFFFFLVRSVSDARACDRATPTTPTRFALLCCRCFCRTFNRHA